MLTWAPTVFEQLPFQSIPFAHDGPIQLLALSLISLVQLKKACLIADIRKKKLCYFGRPYHQAQHTPTCIVRSENRTARSRGYTKNYVDGEHNRAVRIWICGGNKEGTSYKLLAATHCICPSNGWNLMTATISII